MKKYRILYNPYASSGKGFSESEKLYEILPDSALSFFDMTEIQSYADFFSDLPEGETVIVAGGDGTLNKFANETRDIELPEDLEYFPCGTGNDFLNDLGKKRPCPPFPVKRYIEALPEITVNGMSRLFVNGIGIGLDGAVIAEVNRLQQKNGKKPDYTLVALKELLMFNTANAETIVDGVSRTYKKVWLAPTMLGRFFGGGMMIAPGQDRLAEDGKVSVLVAHGIGKLRVLTIFPEIFKGTHVRHEDCIEVVRGHEVTVKFDRETALQIDGETVGGVREYSVRTAVRAPKKTKDTLLV